MEIKETATPYLPKKKNYTYEDYVKLPDDGNRYEIIEILSPASAYYDLVEKKELYEKSNVKEYWIIDPKKQRIEIFALEQGKYQLYRKEEKSGKINSKLLTGFEVDLKEIFT